MYDLPKGEICPELEVAPPSLTYLHAVKEFVFSFYLEAAKARQTGEMTRPIFMSWDRRRKGGRIQSGNWIIQKLNTLPSFTLELSRSQETEASKNVEWSKWFNRLDTFKKLKLGWDSYSAPAPTYSASSIAEAFLRKLQESGISPDRLSPSVVGGIGFTFREGGLKVYVEFSNRGSVHALFSDGMTDPVVEKVLPDDSSFSKLILRIKTYLHE
jgi:hypothetical protein